MTAVQERLKAAGISGDAVRTISLDLQPEFDYNDGKQTLRGYVARNTIEVRVDEIGKVGEVVDAAVSSGATSVSNIRFDLKDRQAVQQKALAEAVTDARARADALAKAAGVTIQRIVRIEDQSEQHVPPPRPMAQFRMAAADAATTPVARRPVRNPRARRPHRQGELRRGESLPLSPCPSPPPGKRGIYKKNPPSPWREG